MTLTKSWLQKQIADMEESRDEIPFGLDEDGNNTLAALKMALAGMEAEPYGYAHKEIYEHVGSSALTNDHEAYRGSRTHIPLYAAPQPASVVPDEKYQHLSELYHAQEKRLFKLAQRLKGPAFDKYAHSPSQAIDVLEAAIFGVDEEDCRAAMLQAGNSLVIPDGWVMVPVEPTEDMIIQGFESEPDESFSEEKEWLAYEVMSGCQQAAHRAKLCWAAMIAAAP